MFDHISNGGALFLIYYNFILQKPHIFHECSPPHLAAKITACISYKRAQLILLLGEV